MKKLLLFVAVIFTAHAAIAAGHTVSISVINVACFGNYTGSAYASVSGGVGPFTYAWAPSGGINPNAISLSAGTYTCTVTDQNDMSTVTQTCVITQPPMITLSVFPLSAILCAGGSVNVSATANGGTGVYSFNWSPTIGVSCPTCANTTITPPYSITYTLTVTDANGCVGQAFLSLNVSPSLTVTPGTVVPAGCNMSDGSATVSLSGGTSPFNFNWATSPSQPTPTAIALAAGTYQCTVTDGNGCTGSAAVTVTDSCDYVWPGDANDDAVADNTDILDIGIANGATGTIRANATLNWIGQPSNAWGQTLVNGTDYKWVDCDGNGTIQPADTMAVVQNFGFTHNNRFGAPVYNATLPDLTVSMNQQSVAAGYGGTLDISLGSSSVPASNVYGVAFTLHFDGAQVDANSFRMNENGSWMGTQGNDLMGVVLRPATGGNAVEVALTRLDHNNSGGQGLIANMAFTATNAMNGTGSSQFVHFTISDVTVIDAAENTQQVNTVGDSVEIGDSAIILQVPAAINENSFTVSPNPFNDAAILQLSSAGWHTIVLTDATGRIVRCENFSGTVYQLERGTLEAGMYFCTVVENGENTGVIRLVVK